jgi:hypothetical protein
VAEFRKYDLNRDGFITQHEAIRAAKLESRLSFTKGRISLKSKLEAAETPWNGKKVWTIYTIELVKDRSYRIELASKTLQPVMVLQGADGKFLAWGFNGAWGNTAVLGKPVVITYLAKEDGAHKIVVTTQDGIKPGDFELTVRQLTREDILPGLPDWFKKMDTNGDGQVSLDEWKAAGRPLAEARKYDLDRDGFITAREAIKIAEIESRLKFVKGTIRLKGEVDNNDTIYQGRKAYTTFKVGLERGRSYRIEMVSKVYFAYLFLEGPDGKVLAQHDSGGNGLTARIVHRAKESGVYKIVATSQGGFRTGDFNLTIRERPVR